MTKEDLLMLFINSEKEELSTSELYELAIKEYHVDDKYDDYQKHVRNLQQELKLNGCIVNTRRGYWALVA